MTYGYSNIGGDTPRKIDALNEAVRRYGALPVIYLIEYPEFDFLETGDDIYTGPQPKTITFRLERTRDGGRKYVEQPATKEKCDKRA
jgi:hypothetical protein